MDTKDREMDRELEVLFKSHKEDIAQREFSSNVMRNIQRVDEPLWREMLPTILVVTASILGYLVVLLSGTGEVLIEGLFSLVNSLALMEVPSQEAILSLTTIVALSLTVGYSITRSFDA